ncbi:MAG TPA: hypothetical protein VHZ32_03890 [Rhizomicrobium sp.]|nr:hypothetical protein [Rhizomicrobium sp.]
MNGRTWRGSAGIGALLATLGATLATQPALADSGVSVTLGGFLASEGVYRSRDEQADIGSSFSGVPFSNAPTGHTSETRFTARQSRLSLLVQGDFDSDTHFTLWNEFDFLGAAQTANSNESNSYNLRIRNIYATVDWDSLGLQVLAGQNWSLLTLGSHGISPRNEVSPATIDAQYSVGFNWARQPQLRVTKNWDHQLWLALSVENPQTTFAANSAAAPGISVTNLAAGGSQLDKTNNFSLNHIPDVIGKIAWEPEIGGAQPLHVEAFGIFRSYYDRINVSSANTLGLLTGIRNSDQTGGGFGGSITWNAVPHLLDLQGTVMTGQGIGRYGSGQLPDVTFRPDGSLAPVQETTALAGATLHASPNFDIYAYLGQEEESAKYFNPGTSHLGLGNPAYNLAGCFIEGGACSPNLQAERQANVGMWWRPYQARFGNFRLGLQYSYTHLTAFAGAGGRPTTDDSMVFTSIRFYPAF